MRWLLSPCAWCLVHPVSSLPIQVNESEFYCSALSKEILTLLIQSVEESWHLLHAHKRHRCGGSRTCNGGAVAGIHAVAGVHMLLYCSSGTCALA